MLVLRRKDNETIVIGDVLVKVLETRERYAVIGVEAPSGVTIWRGEVAARLAAEAAQDSPERSEPCPTQPS